MLLAGHTRTGDDSDLSIETLTSDVITLISTLYSASPSSPIILVGHRCAPPPVCVFLLVGKLTHRFSSSFFLSLGGSVAIHAAISGQIKELSGLIVLDVVEGAYATANGGGVVPTRSS